jgi:rhodanese-related sulfurtransferase
VAIEVSVQEAVRIVNEGGVLLDVREPDEWTVVRAPGALHIPMRLLPTSADQLPAIPIACICHLGHRSEVVAEALVGAGWNAVTVRGGMTAWEAAGLPVERG